MAERHGFVVEGLRKMSVISEGEPHDEYFMARYRWPFRNDALGYDTM